MPDQRRTILIVGGGIAGMTAALHIAEAGQRALIIDDAPIMGGSLPLLDKTYPTDSCAVCFIAPDPPRICPALECEGHPNIDRRLNTALVALDGGPGAFRAGLQTRSPAVDPGRCTACGACAQVCPETTEMRYRQATWLGESRKAIDQMFPQAVPQTYVIDPATCTRCGRCLEVCPEDAIDLDRRPVEETVEVAAVILAPGFSPNDPRVRGAYGYGEYANVISSGEYERMLSTSSPARGLPVRPSDRHQANRIAFIHCVGSRDRRYGVPYCSATCCMITAKQVSLTKRRNPEAQIAVFTMDLRAAGRGYERYLSTVRSKIGVSYHRSLVSAVKVDPITEDLSLQFSDGGRAKIDTFDLVVLAVGMLPAPSARQTAKRIGVDLNTFGFVAASDLMPVSTSRAGVFAAGAFREPKDIAGSTVGSIAAAVQALAIAGIGAKGPKELELQDLFVRTEHHVPAIGVFLDAQDPVLTGSLDLTMLAESAEAMEGVVYVGLTIGESEIRREVIDHRLSDAIIACRSAHADHRGPTMIAAAPVTHVALGTTNAFVHQDYPPLSNRKAMDMIRMAVDRARSARPMTVRVDHPEPRALVLGGGLAGLVAAQTLRSQGVETHLLVRSNGLVRASAADLACNRDLMAALIDAVRSDPSINVYRSSRLQAWEGRPGRFMARISTPDGTRELRCGVLVVATGAQEYHPENYGLNSALFVQTQSQFRKRLNQWILGGSLAETPRSTVMIQCADTRQGTRLYCSKTCCTDALTNAIALKRFSPEAEVAILFRDIVTPGFREEHYHEARRRGVLFIRYTPDAPPVIKGKTVTVFDQVLGEEIVLGFDQLVLSTGIIPDPETPALAGLLGLTLTEDGFFRPANIKSQLLDLPRPGMFLAGLCGGPATPEEIIEQGLAAGLRAALYLRRPLKTSLTIATVHERICSGCGLCVRACPANARWIDLDSGLAKVDPWLCIGCGTCVSVCPNGASRQSFYEAGGVLGALDAALIR